MLECLHPSEEDGRARARIWGGRALRGVAAWIAGLETLVLMLTLGCASSPLELLGFAGDGGPPARTADGLQLVSTARVGVVYVRPGAELWLYDTVVVDPVALSYRSPPSLPNAFARRPGNYQLGMDAEDRVRRTVRKDLERELSRSEGLALVSEPQAGTLRVSGRIVGFLWEAPPPRGRDSYHVDRTGEMTLVVAVRDSETGEVLMRLAARRAIRPSTSTLGSSYENSAVNNWAGVRDVSASWARLLREELDRLRGLPAVATPPPGP